MTTMKLDDRKVFGYIARTPVTAAAARDEASKAHERSAGIRVACRILPGRVLTSTARLIVRVDGRRGSRRQDNRRYCCYSSLHGYSPLTQQKHIKTAILMYY
ncbi:hypothetical protein BLAT2472_170049 [Burkholderia latens]